MTTKKTTRTTSEKQKAANRRNAGNSTGPKTNRGKRILKTNAIKHGILAKEILNSIMLSTDQRREFREIFEELVSVLAPVGIMEEILVEKIAIIYWRLRAVLEMEIGETEASSADVTNALYGVKSNFSGKANETTQNPKYESWETVPMSHFLLIAQLCDSLVKWIKETGTIDNFLGSSLREAFHAVGSGFDEPGNEQLKPLESYLGKTGMASDEKFQIEIPEGQQGTVIKHLESISDGMKLGGLARMNRDTVEAVIRMKRAAAPPLEKMGLIMRYETSLDNGLYKALHELQRLQAFRLGKRAHVPIAVDI